MLAWYQTCRLRDGAEQLLGDETDNGADVLDEGSQARPGPDLFYVAAFPERKDAIIKLMMHGYKPSQVCLRLVHPVVSRANYCHICTR